MGAVIAALLGCAVTTAVNGQATLAGIFTAAAIGIYYAQKEASK